MPQIVEIILPANEEGTDAIVLAWLKQPGDWVEEHEPVLEISTDKVTMEVAAPASGVLQAWEVAQDENVKPGTVLGKIAIQEKVGENGVPAVRAPIEDAAPNLGKEIVAQRYRLSPLVKRMLKTHALQPEQIEGTGRGGRITGSDVKAFLDNASATPSAMPAVHDAGASSRLISHTPMRRQIAHHMVESMLKTAPHVTSLFDADMSAVITHRKSHKDEFAARGVKLTFTAYFVYATVQALYTVPEVNSRWRDEGLEVFEDLNIGIATALGKSGLIVPVIHQAQDLGLFGIARRLQQLTDQARSSTLPASAVKGGTFTITNHGVSGSLLATPIINQPQSAILGIGKMEKRVVVKEERGRDTMQILPMIYVTLTIDHRSLDGFQANAFLSRFVEVLERWA